MKKIATILLVATVAISTMPPIMANAATNKPEEKATIQKQIVNVTPRYVDYSNYPAVYMGCDNWYVGRLKWALQYLGYGTYPYNDGSTYFGTNTRDAVYTYQKAMGLTIDGSCGPATWRSLQASVNAAMTPQY